MDIKRILKIVLWAAVAGLLVYVFSTMTGSKKTDDYQAETRADGEGMAHRSYNDEGNVALLLRCKHSNKVEGDRLEMEQIEATIFKKGRMKKDIKVYGKKGYTENDFFDFYAEGNAKILSEDFTVSSHHFHLKDKAELRSAPQVNYETKSLKGAAKAGMEFFLKVNTLKFFDTNGIYKRNKKTFSYAAKTLWFIDEEKVMVLEKNALIRDKTSMIRSDWITLHFDDELKDIVKTTSQKNSYLYFEDREKGESREIKSENLLSLYDSEGRLTELQIMKNARIVMRGPNNRTTVSSDTVEIKFNPETGKAKKAVIPSRGQVNNRGKTRFRVTADSMEIDYGQQGELQMCKGSHHVQYIVDNYRGATGHIEYNVPRKHILLQGEDTQLISGPNTFYSGQFNVDTGNKILTSSGNVKSVIRLEKDSVLFSMDSIFINASKIKILEKENKFTYEHGVNLTQGEVLMECNSLEISGDNSINAQGNVSLTFKNQDKEISLKGELFVFDSKTKSIDIRNRAAIKSDENILKADVILIRFDDKNEVYSISGEDKVNFLKNDISGYSDSVEWDFKKNEMILKGSPRISRQNGGQTTGKTLKINLETSTITILSGETERTETIIR